MFGIREINYRWDEQDHGSDRPSYQQFLDANDWQDIPDTYRQNLKSRSEYDPVYHKSLWPDLKHAFPGSESIRENFSQSWQDFFVLTMLDGLRQGFYLELGASKPVYCNNTHLLETVFDWQGLSIENRTELESEWKQHRSNSRLVMGNCLTMDFEKVLADNNAPTVIDYLQLDLARDATFKALTRLPHERHRFRVITFETDIFSGYTRDQERSQAYLRELGYELLIDNVAVKNYPTGTWEPFEDWYVAPDLVDHDMMDLFRCVDGKTKLPHEIFVRRM